MHFYLSKILSNGKYKDTFDLFQIIIKFLAITFHYQLLLISITFHESKSIWHIPWTLSFMVDNTCRKVFREEKGWVLCWTFTMHKTFMDGVNKGIWIYIKSKAYCMLKQSWRIFRVVTFWSIISGSNLGAYQIIF